MLLRQLHVVKQMSVFAQTQRKVVCRLDMFLHLNIDSQTAHLELKKYSTVAEVFPSLKIGWSKEEKLALINMYRVFLILWDPKDKNYYKRNRKLDTWVKLEKNVHICRMFASTMVHCMFSRN